VCGGPEDVFGDHAVSCKKSGFGDRHLGTRTIFCHIFLIQSRVPHDSKVDIAEMDAALLTFCGKHGLGDGTWDAVDLKIVHDCPPELSQRQAATWLRCHLLEGQRANRKTVKARSPAGEWGLTSPQWCSKHGGTPGAVKEQVKAMFTKCNALLLPSASPAAGGALRQGLNVLLGRSVVRLLEALMMEKTEAPAWWAAALRPPPSLHYAG